jgi:hypothetical protein
VFQYYEYKYLVEPHNIDYVRNILNDLYGNSDPFPSGWVTSVYFDSLDRRSLKECESGEELKRKFRIRAYDMNLESNLQAQIKEKNLSSVYKYKMNHEGSINEWIQPNKKDNSYMRAISSEYCNLEPIIRIDYLRNRYRIQDYRVTLDEKICVRSCEGLREQVLDMANLPFAVLEIKSKNERPFLPLLGLVDLKQMSFSKFYLGVQSLGYDTDALNKYIG